MSRRNRTVGGGKFDHPGLRVMAASPERVFVMKAFAARSRDEEDLRRLADIIGIRSVADALKVYARFFPSEPSPKRSKGSLEDLFWEWAISPIRRSVPQEC